jgi:hypothetical protein
VDVTGTHVTFLWKDYAHGSKRRTMTLTLDEFLRRFLEHVLPRGLPRIRYFGLLASRRRGALLPVCQTLLETSTPADAPAPSAAESAARHCPLCQGPMRVVEFLTTEQIRDAEVPQVALLDTS